MSYVRSVLITGGTAGLGYHAALNIARDHPDYLVVISSRTDGKDAAGVINKTLGQENTLFISLDLADLKNVRSYAENWKSKNYPPIQILILNAALQFPGPMQKTTDGLETTFAISHVGHALLFHLLCPCLAPSTRIVVVSSGTHDPAQKTGLPDAIYNSAEDLAHPSPAAVKYAGRQRYASSKLANVLWTYALDRRLKERVPDRAIAVNAFDPGLMPGTGLAREANRLERFVWTKVLPHSFPVLKALFSPHIYTPEQSGLALSQVAGAADFNGVSGKYILVLTEMDSSKDSYDKSKQDDLWDWTVKYLSNGNEVELASLEELK